ncbi:heavy-metal-associated domain-containing protein [Phaeovibrio sulfidiphilus]|uniref:Heavy-metal-associated domain-containing protein n=1 Tax=Phaeovibrio sulfidiphilus TaxID=1220600 RepID=A0A8J6YNF3_9PROT|nr:heavy-metal-associated domain-containing protein [Phaeovibrio sulfidiphilus]MBE1238008.1 heavy-metal-associated domain-containing protein [Phaeovibrio sulfidiphilus]
MQTTLPGLRAFLDFLIDVRPDLSIPHSLPGRIRLQLALAGIGKAARHDLSLSVADLDRVAGIEEVRVNTMARSLVISYDPRQIPDSFWEQCLSVPDEDLPDLVMQTLRPRAAP